MLGRSRRYLRVWGCALRGGPPLGMIRYPSRRVGIWRPVSTNLHRVDREPTSPWLSSMKSPRMMAALDCAFVNCPVRLIEPGLENEHGTKFKASLQKKKKET